MAFKHGVIGFDAKRTFLDTKLVEGLIGKKNAKAIRIAMSRVRLRAMHSMKKKGKARRPPKRQKGKAYERWMEEVMNQPASAPGSPPFMHSDSDTKSLRNIWFALDTSNRDTLSGVVGPLRFNQKTNITIPRLHEHGGSLQIKEKLENLAPKIIAARRKGGSTRKLSPAQVAAMVRRKSNAIPEFVGGVRWLPMGRRKPLKGQPVRVRVESYPARPFMQPALTKEAPKFPSLWIGKVTA